MTTTQLLDKMIALAKGPGSYSSPLLVADLVTQENLYDFQQKFSELLLDVAVCVPGGQERLVKELPYAFKPQGGRRK
jgi:hypothetical protein